MLAFLPHYAVMTPTTEFDELIRFIVSQGRLAESEARHLIDEVLAFVNEPVADYIRRRHLELQREGLANEAIYRVLEDEIRRRPFASKALSVRQIRRIIYG
ncbi:MAG: hypothetical protein CSB44_04765 [Gammaproteobacteria bacterium]|nr:MAG: hypothetical protein CSB44_04765 [Gammaproteobacteria bacterium]